MKVTRSVRLSEETMRAVAWLHRRHGDEPSDALRRLVRKGLEKELSGLYARGEISLRQMADLLSLQLREGLDLAWREGVRGNVTMVQALEAATLLDTLAEE